MAKQGGSNHSGKQSIERSRLAVDNCQLKFNKNKKY
jgi:hypothetical protein